MRFKSSLAVYSADKVRHNDLVELNFPGSTDKSIDWDWKNLIAYPPFVNSHDHLISNWFPRAGDSGPYINSHIWVEDMRFSESFLERNKVWKNDGTFSLTLDKAPLITTMGVYKNIFSGIIALQDHVSNQIDSYYDMFPINVIKNFKQCHSITLGNWWGGKTAREEWLDAHGRMPFIIHLGEGLDDITRGEFGILEAQGLLQPNTILIHGICLTHEELKRCAHSGTTICWCPSSNEYLIGQTLDVENCLELGINVVLGTDSPMSGSVSMFDEIRAGRRLKPHVPMDKVFPMITQNAQKALFLDKTYAGLPDMNNSNILLLSRKKDDPFQNIEFCDTEDIKLVVSAGKPIYGDLRYLELFPVNEADYHIYKSGDNERFVIGHPEKLVAEIDSILGYHKVFPYIPISC